MAKSAATTELIRNMKRSSTAISKTWPQQYQLNFNTISRDGGKVAKHFVECAGARSATTKPTSERVIMMVGASGGGKSSLVNAFANYIYGVEWEDDFRFRAVDEKAFRSLAVTVYKFPRLEGMKVDCSLTLIDTPGFGIADDEDGIAAIEAYSNEKGSHQLDGILFVVPAFQPRLVPVGLSIYKTVQDIFGDNIQRKDLPCADFC